MDAFIENQIEFGVNLLGSPLIIDLTFFKDGRAWPRLHGAQMEAWSMHIMKGYKLEKYSLRLPCMKNKKEKNPWDFEHQIGS